MNEPKDRNNHEKVVDVLNSLMVINNDRVEGYDTAAKETDEADLKITFLKFKSNSEKIQGELRKEIHFLNGEQSDNTKLSGKLFRIWMDLKAVLAANKRQTILKSCEQGEIVAIETYKNVLEKELDILSIQQKTMIQNQLNVIIENAKEIKLKHQIEEIKS